MDANIAKQDLQGMKGTIKNFQGIEGTIKNRPSISNRQFFFKDVNYVTNIFLNLPQLQRTPFCPLLLHIKLMKHCRIHFLWNLTPLQQGLQQ